MPDRDTSPGGFSPAAHQAEQRRNDEREPAMTLEERITSVLVANGFAPAAETPPLLPGFTVTPGVGANVRIDWLDAPAGEYALLLTKYENRLRANGLTTDHRGRYLYVYEPGD
jgi:hypothetical protein